MSQHNNNNQEPNIQNPAPPQGDPNPQQQPEQGATGGDPSLAPEPKPEVKGPIVDVQALDGSNAQQLGKVLQDAGISRQKVAQELQAGGLSLGTQLALAEKYGEGMAGVITANIAAEKERYDAQVQKANQEIFTSLETEFEIEAGQGAQAWSELQQWGRENLDANTREDLNKLMAKGGLGAKLAVQHMVSTFKGSPSFTQEAALMEGTAVPNYGMPDISAREYSEKMREITQQYGYDSPNARRLQAQRQASIRRGVH